MYTLWCRLVYGFVPEWEILEKDNLFGRAQDGTQAIIGLAILMQCKQTGRVKYNVFINK